MSVWPDAVETLVLIGFGADLTVRGHASDVAGIVAVLAIRLARAVWPAREPVGTFTVEELRDLRNDVTQLKSDVSRVSLVAGVSKVG